MKAESVAVHIEGQFTVTCMAIEQCLSPSKPAQSWEPSTHFTILSLQWRLPAWVTEAHGARTLRSAANYPDPLSDGTSTPLPRSITTLRQHFSGLQCLTLLLMMVMMTTPLARGGTAFRITMAVSSACSSGGYEMN
jgi:hypothetical protein